MHHTRKKENKKDNSKKEKNKIDKAHNKSINTGERLKNLGTIDHVATRTELYDRTILSLFARCLFISRGKH